MIMEQLPLSPAPVITFVGFSYEEAQTRMRAGKKLKREKWPAGMFLTMERVDSLETIMITQPPRKVPISLHGLDTTAVDWTETT